MNFKKKLISLLTTVAMVATIGAIGGSSVFAIVGQANGNPMDQSAGTSSTADGDTISTYSPVYIRAEGASSTKVCDILKITEDKNTSKVLLSATVVAKDFWNYSNKVGEFAADAQLSKVVDTIKTANTTKTSDAIKKAVADSLKAAKSTDATEFVNFGSSLDFGFTTTVSVPVSLADGSYNVYLITDKAATEKATATVAGGLATFELKHASDYVITKATLGELTAGEAAEETTAAITEVTEPALDTTVVATEPAANPTTGNAAPVALAALVVVTVAGVIVANKRK